MIELRLVSREGDYLVLESLAGERFRIAADDSLRELTRVTARAQSGTSPKDIQALIRSGLTVSEVAQQTGESAEYVSMFSGAVLDELRFVLDAALSVTLSDGAAMVAFAELVGRSQAVDSWRIAKRDGRWVVSAQAPSGVAEWFFSPADLTLEPANSLAKQLLAGSWDKTPEAPLAPQAPVAPVSPVAPERASSEHAESERPAASVLDLVSEIKRRDLSFVGRESTVEAPTEAPDGSEPAATKPASAKGRASLPSWDEIVSGTSHPEEEF
jgi:hypothetical protein